MRRRGLGWVGVVLIAGCAMPDGGDHSGDVIADGASVLGGVQAGLVDVASTDTEKDMEEFIDLYRSSFLARSQACRKFGLQLDEAALTKCAEADFKKITPDAGTAREAKAHADLLKNYFDALAAVNALTVNDDAAGAWVALQVRLSAMASATRGSALGGQAARMRTLPVGIGHLNEGQLAHLKTDLIRRVMRTAHPAVEELVQGLSGYLSARPDGAAQVADLMALVEAHGSLR